MDTAVHKLETTGDLSVHERMVIEEMADRIVTRLLERPIVALEEREDTDPAELEALSRLFDVRTDSDGTEDRSA